MVVTMPMERIVLRDAQGRVVTGRAEITRLSTRARWPVALGASAAGILLGGLSILLPGVHVVTTWLLPTVGVGLAATVLHVQGRVERIEARCGACHDGVDGAGRRWVRDPSRWRVRCRRCGHAYAVRA